MWIANKYGFFSIVENRFSTGEEDQLVVRARVEGDLRNLFKNKKILFSEESDYAYRVFITRTELSNLMVKFSETLDYSNFKDSIKKNEDQWDKSPYYSRIWHIMFQYSLEWENPFRIFNPYRFKKKTEKK
jgi:hypothetical protein